MKSKVFLFLFFLSLSFKAIAANSFSILVYPPSRPINWETPKSTMRSYFKTEISKLLHPSSKTIKSTNLWGDTTEMGDYYQADMGHAITYVDCTTSDKKRFERWSSVSGEEFPEVDSENMFKKKIGMGILFQEYIDGYLISGDENKNLLLYYKGKNNKGDTLKPRFLQFEINEKSCDQIKEMVSFYEKFHYDENLTYEEMKKRDPKEILYFTTMIDPYESYINGNSKVGGNCASYAVGLMKVAGLYDQSLEPFTKLELDVSSKLIGASNKQVSFLSIINGKLGNHWSYPDYENLHLSSYDPQKIWDFIGDLDQCLQDNLNCNLKDNPWFLNNQSRMEKNSKMNLESIDHEDKIEIHGVRVN